jgi:hypothetical protein
MSDANGDIFTIMLNKTSDVIRKIRMIGLNPNNLLGKINDERASREELRKSLLVYFNLRRFFKIGA